MIPEGYNGPLKLDMFGVDDVDRVLGLADSFLEHWESDEGIDAKERAEVAERRAEWEVLRPALCELPTLIAALRRAHEALTESRLAFEEIVRHDAGLNAREVPPAGDDFNHVVAAVPDLDVVVQAVYAVNEALRTAGVEP
jgi:hypothetical protein